MTKQVRMQIVGGPELEALIGLITLFAGLLGGELKIGPAGAEPFDLNQFTKPWIPKVLAATVGSISEPGKVHIVRKDKDGNLYCDCKGFIYRGTCRHVDKVRANQKREMPKTLPVEGITVRHFYSRSQRGVVYEVKLSGTDFVCSCPGFNFHGTCKHVVDVRKSISYPGSI